MNEQDYLKQAATRGLAYLDKVNETKPYPLLDANGLRALFDTGLPQKGRAGQDVLTQLADAAEAGLVGLTGNAFYGWVMGSSHTVGVAADWLTSVWGQNSAIYQTAPSAAIAEETAGKWLIDLLGLPEHSSIGFTTGATMAGFTCLAAARSQVLHKAGWDIEAQGQFGAPEINVYVSTEAHSTVFVALRYLGFGHKRLIMVDADSEGRMVTTDLAKKLSGQTGQSIIIAQAGHINTGAFDDFSAISALAAKHDAWMHIDGAFGLWAKASSEYAGLCEGAENADSWSVDGHKWLQVPYDSGFAIVKHPQAHARAMAISAGYLIHSSNDGRIPTNYVPELSRRARGFAVWAVLQTMGRDGIAAIVEGNCSNAARLAARLSAIDGIRILNQISLNQIAVVFEDKDPEIRSRTQEVVKALQDDGRWYVQEAVWRGETILRLSFSSATKPDAQVDIFADAIVACWESVRDRPAKKQQ